MEKRRYQRIDTNCLIADISDGQGFYNGVIKDLSRSGIQVIEVPKRLDETAQQLSVVVSTREDYFKLRVRPRWSRKQDISKILGLEIVRAPLGWAEFIIDQEPPLDDFYGYIVL